MTTTTSIEDTYTFSPDKATASVFKTLVADTLRNQEFATANELTIQYELEDFAEALTLDAPMVATRSLLRRLLDEITSKRPAMTDEELNMYGMKLIRIFVYNENPR